VRWLLALLAWLGSLVLLAPLCFFAAIVLAGPHSSILPSFLQPLVLVLGWASVLVVPVWVARVVWRRVGRASAKGAV
jgi:hypothetical protein